MTASAKGTISAGVGASGEANAECDIFGKVGVSAMAGVSVGLGAEGKTTFEVDDHSPGWGAPNLFWHCINHLGMKTKGKVWFLPVEENVALARRVRGAIFTVLGALYKANEAELARLDDWKVLQSKVASTAAARNPCLETLQRQNARRF